MLEGVAQQAASKDRKRRRYGWELGAEPLHGTVWRENQSQARFSVTTSARFVTTGQSGQPGNVRAD